MSSMELTAVLDIERHACEKAASWSVVACKFRGLRRRSSMLIISFRLFLTCATLGPLLVSLLRKYHNCICPNTNTDLRHYECCNIWYEPFLRSFRRWTPDARRYGAQGGVYSSRDPLMIIAEISNSPSRCDVQVTNSEGFRWKRRTRPIHP